MSLKILSVLFFWVSVFSSVAQNKILSLDEKFERHAVVGGMLPVYEVDGKIYVLIEHSMLDREFLVVAQVDKGKNCRGRILESKGVFVLKANKDDKLDVYSAATIEQLTNTALSNGNVLELDGLKIPESAWNVAGRIGNGFLVDVTDWLNKAGEWYDLSGSLRFSNADKPEIINITPYDEGVCFKIRHYIISNLKQGVVEMVPESGVVPIEISVVLRLLPRDVCKPIVMFPNSPLRTQVALDYGINPFGCVKCDRGIHWNITDDKPLKICIGPEIPDNMVEILEKVIAKASKILDLQRGIQVVRKCDLLDATDMCGVVFANDVKGITIESEVHPATAHLLFGRLVIGLQAYDQKIIRWQLKHLYQNDDKQWMLPSKTDAYWKCVEDDLEKGILMLLGIDKKKMNESQDRSYMWKSLRYVYAGDRQWLQGPITAAGSGIWDELLFVRNARKEVLKGINRMDVVDYYKECIALSIEEYLTILNKIEWQIGDVKRLVRLLEEDVAGFYETEFVRQNMLGCSVREVNGNLKKVWKEFFKREKWLQLAQKSNGSEVFRLLESELIQIIGNGEETNSSAQMLTQRICVEVFCEELKSCRETMRLGDGVAENLVLTTWESIYRHWKQKVEKLAEKELKCKKIRDCYWSLLLKDLFLQI